MNLGSFPRASVALAAVLVVAPALRAQQPELMPVPQVDWGAELMEVRAYAQQRTEPLFQVTHDFHYTDRQIESGITFQHHVTGDSTLYYQPNHYDHGNGVLVADVDGDDLYDLYFITQLGGNELWRNRGDGTFENITAAAGVGLADRVSVTGAFGDIDNDGDPDLYVTTVKMGNVLFRNDGQGHFTDVTEESGVAYTGHSSGSVFFDYDRDGRLDLFVTNVGTYTLDEKRSSGYWAGITRDDPGGSAFSGHRNPSRTETSILYHNEGEGRFRDVSEETGMVDGGWSGDATAEDVNGDGWPDLYVLNMQGDDHYWENQGGKRFVEKTAELFPKTPWGTMGVKFFDWDNDGRQDLLLTDMHSDMSREITPGYEKLKSLITLSDEELQGGDNNIFGNAFYEHRDQGAWAERSDELGLENYWPWGLSAGDLNADGFQDVFISSSMNFPYRYGVNSLLLNNAGERFLDAEFLVGIEPRKILERRPWYDPQHPYLATKKPWFQLDCGGQARMHPLCRGVSGELVVLGNVGTRSSVLFDLDQDGDLDIVTNEFNGYPQILVSDLAQTHTIHHLAIELTGTESNRDGLGAVVEVHAGPLVQTQVNDGQSGYLSHSSMPLYFGLGEHAKVDKIVVRWPSGKVQEVKKGITVDGPMEIVEE
ncbi:MAG: CRTAC1 family protein [Thermoanaerobaculia bacterium]